MTHGWHIHAETGFLLYPQPLAHLNAVDSELPVHVGETLEQVASNLPQWIMKDTVRTELAQLEPFDFSCDKALDWRQWERLHLLYGYFTNAYLHSPPATQMLPSNLAVPFSQISKKVDRPPILSYVDMVLANWTRLDAGDLTLDNLDLLQCFTPTEDERWFFLVHVAIEARAGKLLDALPTALAAVKLGDDRRILEVLREVRQGLAEIIRIINRMLDHCDPDIYYQQVRPYLFGLTNVHFEGVSDEPQTWLGGSGAQSSVVPAILAGLGVRHERSELTRYLSQIRAYMPGAHRQFIESLNTTALREYVKDKLMLTDAYNHCLRQIITFRRAHFYYAKTYIFEKSTSRLGTGGTQFMDFLHQLTKETEAQLL